MSHFSSVPTSALDPQKHKSETYTKAEAMMHVSTTGQGSCPDLPPEIWGNVMASVDDLSLWVTCRQVSKTLRAEAEREFARSRVPMLEISWEFEDVIFDFSYGDDGEEENSDTRVESMLAYGGSKTIKLTQYTADGHRAQFKVDTNWRLSLEGLIDEDFYDCEYSLVEDFILQSLKHSDLDAFPKPCFSGCENPLYPVPIKPNRKQEVTLGTRRNDIPIPDIEFDHGAKTISFEWKSFLDRFFAEEAHVQQMRRDFAPSNFTLLDPLDVAEQDLIGEFGQMERIPKRSIASWTDWIYTYGREENLLYGFAYVSRLRRSYKRAGQELLRFQNVHTLRDMGYKDMPITVQRHRRTRVYLILMEFVRKRGIEIV